jgi:hypothetical protein
MPDGPPIIPSQRTPYDGRDLPRGAPAAAATGAGPLPGLGAAAAVVAVTFRVLSAAAFDPDAALTLVDSAGGLAVMIGAVAATLPYLALGAVLAVVPAMRRLDAGDGAPAARPSRRVAVVVGVLAAAFLILVAPWYFDVVAVAVGPVLWALNAGGAASARAPADPPTGDDAEPTAGGGFHRPGRTPVAQAVPRARRLSRPTVVLLLVVVAGLFLIRSNVWASTERVEFSDRDPLVAYVMSADETWTTVLTYPDRRVLRFHSDLVTAREICRHGSSVNDAPTLVELVTRRLAQEFAVTEPPDYPPC